MCILEESAQSETLRTKRAEGNSYYWYPRIVTESVAAGARLIMGGEAAGSCYLPTILTGRLTAAICPPFHSYS
jgi:hypothetical protein